MGSLCLPDPSAPECPQDGLVCSPQEWRKEAVLLHGPSCNFQGRT